jgi:diguanylate cyclase (GGDEF)-like protein
MTQTKMHKRLVEGAAMKVLVVDDARSNRLLVSRFIEAMGHTTIEASDGKEAVAAFIREKPDLVLMDVMMPGMDGFEATRRIRAIEGQEWVPVIFLSAQEDERDIATGIEAGGDDYLAKPVSQMVLSAKMRAMQRIAEMRGQLVKMSRELEATNQELERLAHIDGLTGIANRRYFDVCLAREFARSSRNRNPLSLILADVDHFKAYNDHYGHQAGDDALKQIAARMTKCLRRPADLVARYGGEEFVVVLPETNRGGALRVAELLRVAIEELAIPHGWSSAANKVTLSLGVACTTSESVPTPEALLADADQALYSAKHAGRNRVAPECITPIGAPAAH